MGDKGTEAVDAYIAGFPPDVQTVLNRIRSTIREAAPEAEETIKYAMPTYVLKGNLVHFAAFKEHIGFYPVPTAIEAFQEELAPYKSGKGTLRFPLDEAIPYDLIRRIVAFRVLENLEQAEIKKRRLRGDAVKGEEGTMDRNRSMPDSMVIPVLHYADVRAAVQWLCRAFGFTERLRIGDHRAQLDVVGGAGSVVVTAGATPEAAGDDPTHAMMVRVADADAHHERAQRAGARILSAPADYPYGERQYSALDLGGHVWTFSQTLADVDPGAWGGKLVGERAI
jgi:uncharacterized protein YdhG (YjbR/CyaY superfamily)/uncharacterized glyoxalase superfamily protein PhnB